VRIEIGRPPLWAEINAEFNVAGKGVLFCWGNTIYNPDRIDVRTALVAHEETHSKQQGDDVEGWWRRYIADPAFRLSQEIPAHQREFAFVCWDGANRKKRRGYLDNVARRLASPLYGGLVDFTQAKALILRDLELVK
jgi:hypothetical protein